MNIAKLIEIGRNLLPLAVPGAGPLIKVATGVADLLDDTVRNGKAVVSVKDAAQAIALADDLRKRVNAHVDRTVDKLRNG